MVITSAVEYKIGERGDGSDLADATLVICSNRLTNLKLYFLQMAELLKEKAVKCLIIYDGVPCSESAGFFEMISSKGCQVMFQNNAPGLSSCRNLALEVCQTAYLIFADDDVLFGIDVIESVCQAMRKYKMQAVGVNIRPPKEKDDRVLFYSSGQSHYLGFHNLNDPVRVPWGAFMGIDLNFCRQNGLEFNLKLGRHSSGLQSGDDTSFIYGIQKNGGRVLFLSDQYVTHYIAAERYKPQYLMKRTFWQGRSEVMRVNIIKGIKKEWRRYRRAKELSSLKIMGMSIVYLTIFCIGILYQLIIDEINHIRYR